MTKDELITKQQIEIEELKLTIDSYKATCDAVRGYLCMPYQWSTKCPDFPEVAMKGIVQVIRAIEDI
ncbi:MULTISPECIES: hypothetical protein [Shewanella]|uniref:hypothetical protein n=1 Tax=Shewanella TaxID=22 RepID=UPI0009038708|nr:MULTISPECIES: hypothetical protein [Shewanella]MCS6175350.1 hypothetical protein [Shewanella baltica]OUS52968.1 hypothetical protein BM607_003275 [Shewanella sp. SACH]SUI65427.1 Uncharacterised protein [Shewanella baltica]